MTRRRALAIAASATSVGVLPVRAARAKDAVVGTCGDDGRWAAERARVMELGFTEDEALCWEYISCAPGKFFELPVLHEIAEAVHVFQNKLLSRPTYRRYVELARQQNGACERD